MVALYRGPNWRIAVYGREHGTPHFHVEGRDFRCSVAIDSLEKLVGDMPAAVLREALAWARLNRPVLLQKWSELNGDERHR